MRTNVPDARPRTDRGPEERSDLKSYGWGISLALLLTVIAFALMQWGGIARFPLFIVIGLLALSQMIVHFRFFLHITFSQKREDLLLILFTTLLLCIMVGGSIWIMGSLALRMMRK